MIFWFNYKSLRYLILEKQFNGNRKTMPFFASALRRGDLLALIIKVTSKGMPKTGGKLITGLRVRRLRNALLYL